MDDEARFAALYPRLVALAHRYAREGRVVEPGDLVHEAWLRAQRAGRLGLPGDELRRYLTAAIATTAIDRRRRDKFLAGPVADWLPAPDDVEDEALVALALADVRRAAATNRGVALLLLVGCGYSTAEAGARVGYTRNGTKVTMHRARKALAA